MNNTTRRFPMAFGGQRGRGGGGGSGYRQQQPTYPPPQKEEKAKTVDLTSEMNFPALGGNSTWSAPPVTNTVAGSGAFASLASKWKESDDAEIARQAAEKVKAAQEEAERQHYSRTMRMVGGTRNRLYTENYSQNYSNQDEEYEFDYPSEEPHLSDDWETVEKNKVSYAYDRGSRWEHDEDENEDDEN